MSRVVVVGGAVIDLFLYPHQSMRLRDSNPGYLKRSLGGVGRNIAENLGRLKIETILICPLGKDNYRRLVLDQAQEIGFQVYPIDIEETPLYISLIDEMGEDLIGVALMDEIESIPVDRIMNNQDLLDKSDLIVMDTNLSDQVLGTLLKRYSNKTCVDAISGQKAVKLKPHLSYIHTLKMNLTEAENIAGFGEDSPEGLDALGDFFLAEGTKEIFITLGKKGVFYTAGENSILRPSVSVDVINSTGAGDAFFAGVIYAKVHNLDPLSYGLANACLNLTDSQAVSSKLTPEVLEKTVKELKL